MSNGLYPLLFVIISNLPLYHIQLGTENEDNTYIYYRKALNSRIYIYNICSIELQYISVHYDENNQVHQTR